MRYSHLIEFNLHCFSVVGDVSNDCEASMVTLSVSRSQDQDQPIQSLEGADRDRVVMLCTYIYRGEYIRVCVSVFDCTVSKRKL